MELPIEFFLGILNRLALFGGRCYLQLFRNLIGEKQQAVFANGNPADDGVQFFGLVRQQNSRDPLKSLKFEYLSLFGQFLENRVGRCFRRPRRSRLTQLAPCLKFVFSNLFYFA